MRVGGDLTPLQKKLAQAEKGIKGFGKGMEKVGSTLTKGITLPMIAIGAGMAGLVKKAIEVEKGMNEVFTLLPGITKNAMDGMTKEMKQFSTDFGVLPDKVIPSLYQAISAGVPQDTVFDFLAVAQKAAIGGVTELETAVDGITSVVNAYGSDVVGAAKASDIMFTTVRLGKTNFEQLSKSLFNVIPVASSLGVNFEDVGAGLAAITAQGTPTSVATTQMRQMFVELSKAGGKTDKLFRKLAGVSFKEFIEAGGNTQDALIMLERHAKKSNLGVNDLFGSVEAGNAALALTGKGTEKFAESLAEMEKAAGATDAAFKTMDEGTARQLERIKVEFHNLGLAIADEFLPILENDLLPIVRNDIMPMLREFAEKIGDLAKKFSELDPEQKKNVGKWLAIAFVAGPVLKIFSSMIGVLTSLKGLLFGAAGGATALHIPLLAISKLGAVGFLVWFIADLERAYEWLLKVVGGIDKLWDKLGIKSNAKGLLDDFFTVDGAHIGKGENKDTELVSNLKKLRKHFFPRDDDKASFERNDLPWNPFKKKDNEPTPIQKQPRGFMPFKDGGIVTKPMMGLVGEVEHEAIIPLSKLERMMGMGQTQSQKMEHTGTVTVRGVNDKNQLVAVVDMVMDQLYREAR